MAEAEKKEYPMIYRSIAGVIADVGAVGKDKMNKQQGFKFRSIDDVYNALHPALAKNKVVIVPDILEREVEKLQTAKGTLMHHVTCTIKFTFYAEDGSSIEAITVGEGMDSGDKATNKAMAIAFKYACFQVFCIPTEEMKDPDGETPEPVAPAPQFTPATAEQLHKINRFVDAYAEMCENANAVDIVNQLKKMYNFSGTSDISTELANKLIKQVETWYKKRKEADA